MPDVEGGTPALPIYCYEGGKPRFRQAGEFDRAAAPVEFEAAGVEGVIFKYQFGAVVVGQVLWANRVARDSYAQMELATEFCAPIRSRTASSRT